jgi:multicomponent Na+:H+ antiporter subunit D
VSSLHPALVYLLAGLFLPFVLPVARRWMALLAPVLSLLLVLMTDPGSYLGVELLGYQLAPYRLDGLSFVWALIFNLAAALAALYAWHLKDPVQQTATLLYAGAAQGAVLAGDLITLFVWWEMTAIASVFLVWATRTPKAVAVGVRYLVIQVGSGVLLLAGLILRASETGSIAFDAIGLDGFGGKLIFLAFGIKCAFPLLHNWLQDSYPESTPTGTVVLSVFTTKLAVYALARGYAGTDMLIWIGATMTVFPIFFAVIENDLRRVLAYSLNNQLGFMVVGIGIGTELALNGTAAHAFSHILYKALLFMSMGAVLYRVGTVKASELGGLYKSMPLTAVFCIVGSLSISAFPLFSGFISKSIILAAAAEQGYWLTWLVLLFASAGVLDHSGIKVPFFAFFAHDNGKRCDEAPAQMLWAMGLAAGLCIGIGVYPSALYDILPFPAAFEPYTVSHVLTQMQLLLFAALAFVVLMKTGLYPAEIPSVNLDSDWLYRRLAPRLLGRLGEGLQSGVARLQLTVITPAKGVARTIHRHHGPHGVLARTWPTGSMVLWITVILAAILIFYYLE